MARTKIKEKIFLILFGLFLTLIILEVGLRITGAVILSFQEQGNAQNSSVDGVYRILCLGESTTMLGGPHSYPRLLEKILSVRAPDITFQVINKGLAGTTTTAIVQNLPQYLEQYNPQLVIAMMGINDRGEMASFDDSFWIKMGEVLNSARIVKLVRLLSWHIKALVREDRQEVQEAMEERIKNEDEALKWKKLNYLLDNDIGIKVTRQSIDIWMSLGMQLIFKNENKKAIKIFDQIKKTGLRQDLATFFLGKAYRNLKDPANAEKMFLQAIERNPGEQSIYTELGDLYLDEQRYSDAQNILQKAITVTSEPSMKAYLLMGRCYDFLGEPEVAETMLLKAIEANPDYLVAQFELEEHYSNVGKKKKSEEVLLKAIRKDSANDVLYDRMGLRLTLHEKGDLAQEYYQKASEIRGRYFNPQTRKNYHKIHELLLQKGIPLVSVQYPLRDIEPLKSLMGDKDDIWFVDNKENFQQAIDREGFNAYFEDIFAGDFGHCTPKGNKLLAENIAKEILLHIPFL